MIKIPKISIITPSFNQGEFLEECIDSVLSQNYPNIEYIIMDGGSTDNSVEIIKKYEKYLTHWRSGRDAGQYAAIDEGFKKTTGEIMAWLNSDDKYHHHAFFKAAYIFTTYPHVEWLTGRPTWWDASGDVSSIQMGEMPEYSREKYLRKDFIDPSIQQESTFWKRSLWERAGGGIRADLEYAGDLDLWIRFFRIAPLYRLDAFLGGYRKHGNQKVELFKDRYIAEAVKLLNEEIALFRKGETPELLPMPEVLKLSRNEVRSFIDSLYSETRHEVYKISGDSAAVVDFLMSDLNKGLISRKEMVIKDALVVTLQKLRLYKFYRKNEDFFSRVYYFFRRFFLPKDQRDRPVKKYPGRFG
jgi:glycosyltransferase involved in cell wall biosynthesis